MSTDTLPPTEPPSSHTLPVGALVGGLEITGLIGEGGFGIVYKAFDTTLQRQVALKEYMPSSLASRAAHSADVTVKSSRFKETFDAGLRSFVNEARLLAHFDHPALVKVHQFWQGNRTAYMVMPFYEGPTLKAYVREVTARGDHISEATLRAWLAPLLDALELMHAEHCYHRDIAPDNILLTARGPLLLDFGAARRVISDMTQALTVILKPGYAPIEQYGDAATMVQGPWTDLYALASVIYYCITGRSPITSVERMMGDPLPLLAKVAEGRYSATFLDAIDAALAVRPKHRPQNVADFRALLAGTARPADQPPRGPLGAPGDVEATVPQGRARPAAAGGVEAGPVERTQPHPPPELPLKPMPPVPEPQAPAPAAAGGGGKTLTIAALALGAAAVAVAAGFLLRPRDTPSAALPPAAPASAPRAVPMPAPAPMPAAAPAATPAPASSPSPSPSPSPSVGAPAVAQPLPAAAPKPTPAAPAPATPPPPPPRPKPAPEAVRAPAPPKPAPPPPAPPKPAPAPAPAPAVTASPAPAPAQRPASAARVPAGKPARCGELLEKGNKGTLSLDEALFLRQECR